MKHQIPLFRLTLGPRQSIGPARLQALWASACQTPDVSVGRTSTDERPTYSLYASQQLANLQDVERRMRRLLDDNHFNASLYALHAN